MNIPEISSYYPPFANQTKPAVTNPVFQTPQVTPVSTAFLQKREVEYVNGVEGANTFQMAPNSSALALDKDQNILWVMATDQNGSKSVVKGYWIGDEYIPPKPVTMEDLMAQMQSMNERLTKMEGSSNGQYDLKPTGQSKSNGPGNAAGFRNGAGNAVPRDTDGSAESK